MTDQKTDSNMAGSINPAVFYSSSIIIFSIILFAVIAPEMADQAFKAAQSAIVANGS